MIQLPTTKTNFALSIAGAASICALLFVVLSASAVPPAPEAPYPPQITLDPSLITARAAVVYDLRTNRILYEKNSNEPLPLASLTKLMAAAAVLASTDTSNTHTITRADLAPDGDWTFIVGEKWNIADLLRFGLVASSNDAIAAAAGSDKDIILAMNRTAGELGLTHTYFVNPTGLDVDHEMSGAYGSAHDMALLTAAFLRTYPALFEATAKSSVSIASDSRALTATSTALPLISLPGFIGAKTGYTDLAGGNLVAAFDLEVGHPIVVAVLGSTREGRFTDVLTLINALRP